jgi:hypothetical protein
MEFMEIKQEHRDFLDANINNYESAQNGYIRNLDLPELQMYEHIYRLYLDPNFLLSVWCGACKFDMIMRLYNWYVSQPKPKENNFYSNIDVSKLKDISDRVEIKETPEGIEVTLKPEPKKRGRKPKANG